jgi:hypothetical protein
VSVAASTARFVIAGLTLHRLRFSFAVVIFVLFFSPRVIFSLVGCHHYVRGLDEAEQRFSVLCFSIALSCCV